MIVFRSRDAAPQSSDRCLVFCPPGAHSEVSPVSGMSQPQWARHERGFFWDRAETNRFEVVLQLFLGDGADGRAVWVVEVADTPGSWTWATFRTLIAEESEDVVTAASRAAQILYWDKTHRFCGTCGTLTERNPNEFSRRCPRCLSEVYPRINPAVIMLVHRGDEILLARHRRSVLPIFSCLAGYVEAGETLEAAVCREVYEEVGLRVESPRYWTSQSWPFPNSLMLAFYVAWSEGEVRPDGEEIVEANWYTAATLPDVPPPYTIAGRLISNYFEEIRR